jgi:hypothetical protein
MMDRSDEKRDEGLDHDRTDSTYNPLGIGNANPPRDRVRPGPEDDEESAGVDETGAGSRPGSREIQRSPGATSIDMGAGGTGTELERD